MTRDVLEAVPAERRDAALAALISAFGTAPATALRPVAGGVSALSYRVEHGGRAYVLRLEGPRGGLRDPQRSYAAMQIAAKAGLAPPVRFADPVSGIAIIDFIVQQPLGSFPGGPAALAHDLGRMARSLQATPVFPPLAPYPLVLEGLLRHVAGLATPGLLDRHLEGLGRIRAAYPWDAATSVSSHNDPNPRNILFDGQRLWLVDWETAFRNLAGFVDALACADFNATLKLASG